MENMRLILIRHAKSRHSIDKNIAGPVGCRGLTEAGFHQARALADRLRITGELGKVDLLLSSPVLRARQTADPIAAMLQLPIVEDSRLTEVNPGVADGLSWTEYDSRFGSFDLAAEPDRPYAPGGETWNEYITRVPAAMQSFALEHPGQTVVAVTHGGFIVISFLTLFGVLFSADNRAWIDPSLASLTEWEWMEDKMKWRLNRYNA